jgi:hypothetical protein
MIEPDFEREVISNLSSGKETTPETAFIAWPALETYMLTANTLPTALDPVDGEKYKTAARAGEENKK